MFLSSENDKIVRGIYLERIARPVLRLLLVHCLTVSTFSNFSACLYAICLSVRIKFCNSCVLNVWPNFGDSSKSLSFTQCNINTQGRELALERRHTAQQQRPESPTVTLTWHACKYKVHKLHQRYILKMTQCNSRDFFVSHTYIKNQANNQL